MVTAQDQQTQQGTAHPDQGGAVVFPLLPLVEKHDHEQGGHHEFNACGVKVDQVPQQGAGVAPATQ